MISNLDWRNYHWELIHTKPQSPILHMALDKQITHEVGLGLRSPTLRIWEWSQSSAVIGRFQSLKNEINMSNAHLYQVEVVRRISGGGAMFIEPKSSITYSLSIPEHFVKNLSFEKTYELLEKWLLKALINIGIKCWFKPINDIESELGKIGGSAQARFSGAILHHGTLSYDIDVKKMSKILRIGQEKLSDKGIKSAEKRVSGLKIQSNMSRSDIIGHIVGTFNKECAPLKIVEISENTLRAAEKLAAFEFKSEDWLNIVP